MLYSVCHFNKLFYIEYALYLHLHFDAIGAWHPGIVAQPVRTMGPSRQ